MPGQRASANILVGRSKWELVTLMVGAGVWLSLCCVPARADPVAISDDWRFLRNQQSLTEQKINGGMIVRPDSAYPAIVGIAKAGSRELLCTGTLIAPDVVVTAAHCIRDGISGVVMFGHSEGTGRYARAIGSRDAQRDRSLRPADRVDLGVIVLAQTAAIEPIKYADPELIDHATDFRIVGFGTSDSIGLSGGGIKRETVVPSATNDCRGTIVIPGGPSQPDAVAYGCRSGREIVAGRADLDKDTCRGDSGGPLFVNQNGTGVKLNMVDGPFLLAGVTSRKIQAAVRNCGDGGIYVRLTSTAQAWIQTTADRIRRTQRTARQ